MADATPIGVRGFAYLSVAAAIGATILALLPEVDRPASSPVVFVEPVEARPPSPSALSGPMVTHHTVDTRVIFAGDIMQHATQAAGSFEDSYAKLAPLVRGADLAVANLEFPVDASKPVGPDDDSVRFNGSPAHLDALKNAGFRLFSLSNNHIFDQGVDGIAATLAELERRELYYVGTARSRESLERQVVAPKVGKMRIAFSAYTGVLNTYLKDEFRFDDPPADLPLHFANFAEWDDEYREQAIAMFRKHVIRARASGPDLIVALVHWGEEWHFGPTDDQRRAAHDLIDAGFDLVVGGHGHVLNGPEIYDGKLIVYSLGNLVCDFAEWQARTGALLEVLVRRTPGSSARVVDYRLHPVLVRRDGHVIEPLDATAEAAGGEKAEAWRLARRLLGDDALSASPLGTGK